MFRNKTTAKDVAERAGVSRSLVSMYLRKNPNLWISETTKARLEAAIRELGYRPNRSAQILRSGKSSVAGVILGGISGTFASCLSEALMEKMEDAGYRIFLGITRYDPERERRVLESMMNFEIDLLFYTLEPEYVKDLLLRCATSIPVLVSEKRADMPFRSIRFDLSSAMKNALRHLAGRQVGRTALLTNRAGFGEEDFFASKEEPFPELRSFRFGDPEGRDKAALRELVRFSPDAVISLAGIPMTPAKECLGRNVFWIDSWTLPFERPEAGIHPAGSIVRPFREYVETLSEAMLEALRDPECKPRDRSVPAAFLKWREQSELRKSLLNDPYYQTFQH